MKLKRYFVSFLSMLLMFLTASSFAQDQSKPPEQTIGGTKYIRQDLCMPVTKKPAAHPKKRAVLKPIIAKEVVQQTAPAAPTTPTPPEEEKISVGAVERILKAQKAPEIIMNNNPAPAAPIVVPAVVAAPPEALDKVSAKLDTIGLQVGAQGAKMDELLKLEKSTNFWSKWGAGASSFAAIFGGVAAFRGGGGTESMVQEFSPVISQAVQTGPVSAQANPSQNQQNDQQSTQKTTQQNTQQNDQQTSATGGSVGPVSATANPIVNPITISSAGASSTVTPPPPPPTTPPHQPPQQGGHGGGKKKGCDGKHGKH